MTSLLMALCFLQSHSPPASLLSTALDPYTALHPQWRHTPFIPGMTFHPLQSHYRFILYTALNPLRSTILHQAPVLPSIPYTAIPYPCPTLRAVHHSSSQSLCLSYRAYRACPDPLEPILHHPLHILGCPCPATLVQATPSPQILYKPNNPPASLHPDFPSPTSPLVFLVFPEPGQELCGSLSSRIQLFPTRLRRSGLGLPLERLHDVAGKRKTGITHPKKPREGARRPLLPKSLPANPGSLPAPSPARREG